MQLAIVGGGPAGIAAAIWARRLGHNATIYERDDRLGGQLHQITLPIPDIPGMQDVSATALLRALHEQLSHLKADVRTNHPIVAFDAGRGIITDGHGRQFNADHLIYAPGLKTRRLRVPGSQWVTTRSVSELVGKSRPASALVVGGGDRAAEAAVRLQRAGIKVTLVHRRHAFRARKEFQQQLAASGVELLMGCKVSRIEPDSDNGLTVYVECGAGQLSQWIGTVVVVRIGMEPDNIRTLVDAEGETLPIHPGTKIWTVGDAATAVPYRSVVEAYASAMRAVKRLTLLENGSGNIL